MSKEFKHILVPVDFSENSEVAMKLALEYFGDKAASVTILTVCEGSHKKSQEEPLTEIDYMMAKSANIEMTRFKRMLTDSYPDCKAEIKTMINHGTPSSEIINVANSSRMDLVIMGSKGRNSLVKVFFGSTTYQVSRKVSCSVLVARF